MWIIPTLCRPGGLRHTLASLGDIDTPGIVVVNGGDYGGQKLPENWQWFHAATNLGLCGALRWVFKTYPEEPWYGVFGDDEFALTPGWDEKLIAAAGRDKMSQAFNLEKGNWPLHGFLTWGGDLVRTAGNLAPERLWHWYLDAYWQVIGVRTNRLVTLEDVQISTTHHIKGTAPFDETYRLGESRKDEDQKVFLDWLRDPSPAGMRAICERLK